MTRTRRGGRWATIATAVLAVIIIAAVRGLSTHQDEQTGRAGPPGSQTTEPSSTPDPTGGTSTRCDRHAEPASQSARTVQAAFARIRICPTDTSREYRRDAFGSAWTDDNTTLWGHNGCDTRSDLLRRDLINKHYNPNPDNASQRCRPITGRLPDPYTGRTLSYRPGPSIQGDHVISLHRAWQTGAQHLTDQQRTNLANDPLNVLMVDEPTNESKSDRIGWLPPNQAFGCRYLALQIAVAAKYQLWHTSAEHHTIAGQLRNCPTMPLPTEPGGRR